MSATIPGDFGVYSDWRFKVVLLDPGILEEFENTDACLSPLELLV